MLASKVPRRILGAGRSIAVFAIVVDAKDERAVDSGDSFSSRPQGKLVFGRETGLEMCSLLDVAKVERFLT